MPQANAFAAVVGLAIENAVAPLVAEIADLKKRLIAAEARAAVPGPPGRDGVDGAAGEPGRDGRDGADGLGFDDLACMFDGERTLTLSFKRGDQLRTFPVALPFLRYVGVFAHGATYHVGDVVTHSGSAWHCQVETGRAPHDGGSDWKLMVKQGRDGRRDDRR